jgi:hypothetical protein
MLRTRWLNFALNAPPFPIDFCHAMCGVPPIDEARAAANAAMHAEIVRKVEYIEAFFTKKLLAIMSTSILLPAKQARCVQFHNITSQEAKLELIRKEIATVLLIYY